MYFDQDEFVSLGNLSSRLSLPERYLKELSNKSLIPCLNINGRLRFNVIAVKIALDKLASKGGKVAKQLLKPNEVDSILRYPAGRSTKLVKAGLLPFIRLPDGQIRFDERDIEQLLEKQQGGHNAC